MAEKVERDVLIPINELAQSTAFGFQLLQEAYKSQAEVLEGSIDVDVDADSTSDGKPQGIGNDSLSIGLKNLIGRLNASHGELRGRVGLIQDAFDRQKASLEHLVAKAMQKRNKVIVAYRAVSISSTSTLSDLYVMHNNSSIPPSRSLAPIATAFFS